MPVSSLQLSLTNRAKSNQLQRLIAEGILSNVRNGTSIHYCIVDPCTMSLLDQGLCLSEDTLKRQSNLSSRRSRATG